MFFGEEVFRRAHAIHVEWTKIAADVFEGLHPEAGTCRWSEGDTCAVFAGDGNPLTQCYGLGMGEEVAESRLDSILSFFEGRTSKWELILTPFESPAVWNLAMERGLRFDHFENLLFLPLEELGAPPTLPILMEIEQVSERQFEAWGDLSMRAFCGEALPPFADDLKAVLRGAVNSRKYWGTWEGEPVAAASCSVYEGSVFLGGMGTLEGFRKRGFQRAMLDRRVRDAQSEAEIALVEALPGSSSHRNIERMGFRVAYSTAVLVYESSSGM